MKTLFKLARFVSFLPKITVTQTRILNPQKYVLIKFPNRSYCSEKYINSKASTEKTSGMDDSSSDSSSASSSSEEIQADAENELRTRILEASLLFVNNSGWTSESISKGAESEGYSSMVHGMFENGGIDLINYFYVKCNSSLENQLKNIEETRKNEKKMKTTDFLRQAVELRLRMNAKYMDTWPKALALHASPTNLSSALDNIGNLVDTIWFYAGDRSVDFNWYTKRGTLAVIYKSTEFCMLQDKSDDFQETWSFLERRLEEINSLGRFVNQTGNRVEDFRTLASVGLITVQNIFGLNTKSR